MKNPHESREEELRRREETLKEREVDIRLRELESEVGSSPVLPTSKHSRTDLKRQRWYRRLVAVGQFFLIVVAVIVAVRIAAWLASLLLILGVSWVIYKLFLEPDRL
jgi:hypothetical protein